MRLGQILSSALLLSMSLSAFAYTHSKRATSAQRSYSRKASHPAAHTVGQRSIVPDFVREHREGDLAMAVKHIMHAPPWRQGKPPSEPNAVGWSLPASLGRRLGGRPTSPLELELALQVGDRGKVLSLSVVFAAAIALCG